MPTTILTIAGVDYDRHDRPAARVRMDELVRDLDGGYDTFSFTEVGGHPLPAWHDGQSVAVTWVEDDLTERLLFSGIISGVHHGQAPTGWLVAYTATSKKQLCDQVPVTGFDQTGVMKFNLSPEDPSYVAAEAGLEVGQILRFVLTVAATATSLDALGVGGYTTLSPPTLPASTEADLALLTIVPSQQVSFTGSGVLAQCEQLLQHWMPKWVMEQTPAGTLRFKDTTDLATFVPVTVVLPNATSAADPVTWPAIRKSTSRCATRVVIRGAAEVEAAILSVVDGTLAEVWTSTEESDWTYSDFTSPKDAYSEGSITAVTGSSATVDPDDASRDWGANFWSGRQAKIFMTSLLASGLEIHQERPVTSNTACAAGGSCTITWDATWPLDSTGYTRYRLVGGAGGNSEVGRLYTVREPATDDTGLDTYVGSHLVRRSPLPIKAANNSGYVSVHYPFGYVCWSPSGDPPYNEWPLNMEVIPTAGRFRFIQPVAAVFGAAGDLERGYPTDPHDGLPGDVRVVALYSRGTLEAIAPPNTGVDLDVPAHEGTANSVDGLEITKVIDLPSWADKGALSRMQELAQQHLDSLKDVVHEGSFDWYGVPPWNWWEFGTSINFSIPPLSGPWESINAPIRSVRLTWPTGEGMIHKVTIGFSSQRRPYSGDDLYVPAAFSHDGIDTSQAFDTSQSFVGEAAPRFDSGMDALGNSMGVTGNGSTPMLGDGGSTGGRGGRGDGDGGFAADPFEAARQGGFDRPSRTDAARKEMNEARADRQELDSTYPGMRLDQQETMRTNARLERERLDRGAPPKQPVGPPKPLPPRERTDGEKAMSERGRAEGERMARGESPPQRPATSLPGRPRTEGENEAADRGRAERQRLDSGAPPKLPVGPPEPLPPRDPPSRGEDEASERGRAERHRLDDL